MNKAQKLAYIRNVQKAIAEAPNHGRNGSNWWYPTPYTVAYNVKMHGASKGIDDVRAKMSPVQKKYYEKDDDIYTAFDLFLEDQRDQLKFHVETMPLVVSSGFAGRSGGWFEVTYTSLEDIEDDAPASDVNALYKEYKALADAEQAVRDYVHNTVTLLQQYMNTEEYIQDILGYLLDDEDIIQKWEILAIKYTKLSQGDIQ